MRLPLSIPIPIATLVLATLMSIVLAGCGLTSPSARLQESDPQTSASTPPEETAPGNQTRPAWQIPGNSNEAANSRGSVVPVSAEEIVQKPEIRTFPEIAALPEPPIRPGAPVGTVRQEPATAQKPVRKVARVGAREFDKFVLESDTPVLVDFYADWCGPCKKLTPVLDQLAQETPDVRIVKVDIDDAKSIAKKYRVSSIPTLIVFKDGKPVSRQQGLASKAKIQKLLAR